jgi:hypothetical protein
VTRTICARRRPLRNAATATRAGKTIGERGRWYRGTREVDR